MSLEPFRLYWPHCGMNLRRGSEITKTMAVPIADEDVL